MKASIFASIFVAAGFAAAQSINISDVPTCALSCVMSSSPDGCGAADYACWCRSNTWLSSLADCVRPACPSEADQAKLVALAQGLCGAYSVTISSDILASATATPSGSSGNASATTTRATSTSTPTSTGSAASQSSNAAGHVVAGSGLMAAAAGVAMFVL
ncbi:uncharacterized protein H6S33_005112 [Morchella sextelata]|uniref:uncharacterized protein n=1 Tax=Morchella sextelata TaxID=1174677 RepID=UPI001D04130F|nr:uncharacterized protein H6S33_005112 [Morchella sextelata]KAH0605130.1 hypothetical protein H6S33_005112 [Morchella sextelata]